MHQLASVFVFSGLWYTPVHLRVTCASP